MDIKLINIGFGNIVSANRVVAIVSPESAPIKRIISEAKEHGKLIDATYGRRTRAVIITDSSHVVLSAIQPETVANRFVVTNLKDLGRAEYYSVTDQQALDAFQLLSRLEGIIPALETSHAIAYLETLCPQLSSDQRIIINCSGRGDKDVNTVIQYLNL